MDQNQMKERCQESRLIDKAVLRDYQLAFTIYSPLRKCGCADIVKSERSEVWGLLYEVTPADMSSLDRYESHPKKYKRFEVTVFLPNRTSIRAESYEVVNKADHHIPPSRDYLDKLINAAYLFSFPSGYIRLLSESKAFMKPIAHRKT